MVSPAGVEIRYALRRGPRRRRFYADHAAGEPRACGLIGRGAELAKLRARLARARAGSGAVVALVGEAGIGKTRTALAFAERARDEGAVVAIGSCAEGDWTAPFLPWSQALGSLVQSVGQESAQRAVGAGRGTLAWFVRELTASAPAPLLDARDERLRLHHSVGELLARASEAAPLVLVIDDLHWADDDSLALLQSLARRASSEPWVIVLAYREGEVDHGRTPLGDVLGALKDGDFERIPLRGLALPEVREYARGCAGRALPDSLVRVLYDETVGNPFYVREVLRLLADEQILAGVARIEDATMRQLGVPRGVRDVVARRFARLVEPAARVLRVASAMPDPSDIPLLLDVTELDEPRLRGAVAMALSSGLLAARSGFGERTRRRTRSSAA